MEYATVKTHLWLVHLVVEAECSHELYTFLLVLSDSICGFGAGNKTICGVYEWLDQVPHEASNMHTTLSDLEEASAKVFE